MRTAISGSATGLSQPCSDTDEPDSSSARCIRKPTSGAAMPTFCMVAGAPRPTFQPSGFSPAAMRARRVASCAGMPFL